MLNYQRVFGIIPTDELIFFRGVETTNQGFIGPIFFLCRGQNWIYVEKGDGCHIDPNMG